MLVSDYGSGSLGPSALEALRAVKRGGLPVCVDSRYRLLAYTGLTMVKPNEPELEAASGVALSGPGALERAARALLRRLAASSSSSRAAGTACLSSGRASRCCTSRPTARRRRST